ncbi:MAG: hypothetical protein P1P88_04400, partial [Bacteroidales bacterium]|nr:hypothetical protein [Bacteroidales bacterium]
MKKSNSLFRTLAILFFSTINYSLSAQADAGIDQVLCSTDFILAGSVPQNGTGVWTLVSGSATIVDPSSYNSEAIASPGENILRWTTNDSYGETFDEVYLINASPSLPISGADQIVCSGSSLVTAEKPLVGNGSWTVIGGSGTISDENCDEFSCSSIVSALSV